MPAPSPLAIATSAVTRLLKEEATYRKELTAQEQRLKRLEEGGTEADDENREFTLRQERQSIEETKAVFAPLRDRIKASVQKLENVSGNASGTSSEDELGAARQTLSDAKERSA